MAKTPASYLEHLDLAAGRVQVLRVLPILILLKRVNLHTERHALLTPVLPRGELCADAVHLGGGGRAGSKMRGAGWGSPGLCSICESPSLPFALPRPHATPVA